MWFFHCLFSTDLNKETMQCQHRAADAWVWRCSTTSARSTLEKNMAFKKWTFRIQELWMWKYRLITFVPHHSTREGLPVCHTLNTNCISCKAWERTIYLSENLKCEQREPLSEKWAMRFKSDTLIFWTKSLDKYINKWNKYTNILRLTESFLTKVLYTTEILNRHWFSPIIKYLPP